LNLAANVVVSRLIPRTAYGAASSVLALAALLAIPLTSIQPAVTNQVSVARKASVRLWRPTLIAGGVGCVIVGASRLIAPALDRLLHLSGSWVVVLFGVYVASILGEGVPRGALVGMRRYLGVAVIVTVGAIVRLGVATIWSSTSSNAVGPLAGAAIGELLTAGLLAFGLRQVAGRRDGTTPLRLDSLRLSAAGFTGLLSVMSIDTIAARHWLSGPASGLYSAASIAGSIAYFLSTSAAVALFPDVAKGVDAHDGRAFWVGLAEVTGLAAGTALVLGLAAPLVLRVVFPAGYADARLPLIVLSGSYAALGILGYLVNHQLAHGARTILLPWLGAAVLIGAVFAFHGSATTVALDALSASAVMLVLMLTASVVLERRATTRVGTARSAGERAK